MPLRILFSFLALTSLAFAGTFDKPVSTKVVDLGPSPFYRPGPNQPRVTVTCWYFSGFMVKQFDERQKGAARLGIVPGATTSTPCVRGLSQNEKVINPEKWSGYFSGVKGNLVFFDASDGWNGGMPFVVYHAQTMKRIFEDSVVNELEDKVMGGLQLSDAQPVTLTYMRVVDSECNLRKEPAACWTAIQKKFHLESFAAPDCKPGYERHARWLFSTDRCPSATDSQCQEKEIAKILEELSDGNSAIAYPVKVTLGANPVPKPVPGTVGCWPGD